MDSILVVLVLKTVNVTLNIAIKTQDIASPCVEPLV